MSFKITHKITRWEKGAAIVIAGLIVSLIVMSIIR